MAHFLQLLRKLFLILFVSSDLLKCSEVLVVEIVQNIRHLVWRRLDELLLLLHLAEALSTIEHQVCRSLAIAWGEVAAPIASSRRMSKRLVTRSVPHLEEACPLR